MAWFVPRERLTGDDPIFALNQEARRRRARGESIVNATVGVMLGDDGAPIVLPSAARAIRNVSDLEWSTYAPISGDPEFLDAVIHDLFAGHPTMRSAAVAVATPGGSGALRHGVAAFLEPDQAVLTTYFHWEPYWAFANENGRRLRTFQMFDPDSNGKVPEFGDLDDALGRLITSQGRAVVLINDPCHNPTGYSMTADDWRVTAEILARHARRRPLALLLDAAYAAYSPEGLHRAFDALEPLLGDVLLLIAWSASKSFTQYGLRVGCLVAVHPDIAVREEVKSALGFACRGTWSNCCRGGMAAITSLLRDPDLSVNVVRERAAIRELLVKRVAEFNKLARPFGLRYPHYDAGFFVSVFTNDASSAAEKMKKDGVFVVPLKGALRIALSSVAASDVPQLVDSLAGVANCEARDHFA